VDDTVPEKAAFPWARNLVCVWISQVLSLMGFGFAMSFGAYYIQSLGVSDPDAVKVWNGVYQAAGSLTFAVMSPIWGALGDRYGRRLMLLRANFAAAAIVFLMGSVTSVEQLVFLRLCQGVFTGTVSASMTLIATTTPKRRYGLALGSLQTAMLVGWMGGSALGGFLADRLGYATTIRMGALLLLTSALLILFFVREDFQRPAPAEDGKRVHALHLEGILPILILFLFGSISRRFDAAILPLFIQELNGNKLAGSATLFGQMTGICCLVIALSSAVSGWLIDRISPKWVAAWAALGGGLLAGLQALVPTFGMLVAVRLGVSVCIGGLEPAFQVWLTHATSAERRGRLMGFAVSARCVGWIIASLSSSYLATLLGFRPIFLLAALLLLALIPVIFRVAKSVDAKPASLGDDVQC